jgi:hypothetical protein
MLENLQDVGFVLPIQPQDDDSVKFIRRIRSDIREVRIQRNKDSFFPSANSDNPGVRGAGELLLNYASSIVSSGCEQMNRFLREVFINFEV